MLRLDMAMTIISGVIPAPGWRTMHSTAEPKVVDAEEPVGPSVRPESARIEMKDTDSNLAVALGSSAALLYNRPPIPCSSKSDTPPLKEKIKTSSMQSEVQECFAYYQRAIVRLLLPYSFMYRIYIGLSSQEEGMDAVTKCL